MSAESLDYTARAAGEQACDAEVFYSPEGSGYRGCGKGCVQNTWDHHSNYNEDGSVNCKYAEDDLSL